VLRAVDFVSDLPAFNGTMDMTWADHPSNDATRVEFTAKHLPDGIRDDREAGMASSLKNLAAYLARTATERGIR
jgi:hypothetical protein